MGGRREREQKGRQGPDRTVSPGGNLDFILSFLKNEKLFGGPTQLVGS